MGNLAFWLEKLMLTRIIQKRIKNDFVLDVHVKFARL